MNFKVGDFVETNRDINDLHEVSICSKIIGQVKCIHKEANKLCLLTILPKKQMEGFGCFYYKQKERHTYYLVKIKSYTGYIRKVSELEKILYNYNI